MWKNIILTRRFFFDWNNVAPPGKEKLYREFEYDFQTLSVEDEELLYQLAGVKIGYHQLKAALKSFFKTINR